MFPKGDTHKQLFQLMLTMQGRRITSSVLVGIYSCVMILIFSWVEFGTKKSDCHKKVVFC